MQKAGMILPLLMAATVAFGAAPEKTAETKPAEAKPAEVKPAEAKPAEAKDKAAEAKPAAEAKEKAAEVKPAEAKPAETKEKAAVKVKPIVPAFPWIVPAKAVELTEGAKFDVRPEGLRTKVELKAGERVSFILEENLKATTWIVSAVDTKVATVANIGSDEGGWFRNPSVTYEITAVHPGRTLLEMSFMNNRNAPMRMFRCYIEVK